MPVQPRGRLDALTGLRFLAALAIVIHHSRATFVPADLIAGLPLDAAVSFFFVLSGFILTYTYPELPTARHVRRFWLARVARLWPMHITTLALAALIASESRIVDPSILAANAFMVHAWIPLPRYFFSGNAVSWSIATECGFYAMFPLLIWSFRTNWPLKLLAAILGLYALVRLSSHLPDYSLAGPGPSDFGILYFNPIARLLEFVLGMCAAMLWRAVRPRLGTGLVLWTVLESAAVSLLVTYTLYARPFLLAAYVSGFPTFSQWAVHVDLAPCFAIIVFIMASGTGLIGKLLSCRALVYLGEISFSVYMLHQIFIKGLMRIPELLELSVALKFTLLTACVVAASMVSYHLIERPGRAALTSLPDLLRRRAPA